MTAPTPVAAAAATCPIHGAPMPLVCGEAVCGACYGAALLTEPLPRDRPRPALEQVYEPSKHMMVTRRAL